MGKMQKQFSTLSKTFLSLEGDLFLPDFIVMIKLKEFLSSGLKDFPFSSVLILKDSISLFSFVFFRSPKHEVPNMQYIKRGRGKKEEL
jgi:hypothetical protein